VIKGLEEGKEKEEKTKVTPEVDNMAKKGRTKGNKICPSGIAWAKRTFDKYPSAYANMAASKYCKDPNYAKGKK
jgi:hypothetical protein